MIYDTHKNVYAQEVSVIESNLAETISQRTFLSSLCPWIHESGVSRLETGDISRDGRHSAQDSGGGRLSMCARGGSKSISSGPGMDSMSSRLRRPPASRR